MMLIVCGLKYCTHYFYTWIHSAHILVWWLITKTQALCGCLCSSHKTIKLSFSSFQERRMFLTAKIRVWLIAENNVLDANFICHHLYLNNSIYTVLFSGIPSYHTPQLSFSRHWRYTETVNHIDIGRGRPIYMWKLRTYRRNISSCLTSF